MILATAAKWATVRDRSWTWAIVDEAYQMRSDMLLLIADRFDRGRVRRRSRPARPVLRHRDTPLDRTALRPDAERRHRPPGPQPGPARAPAARILAAPGLGRRRRVRRLLPVHRLPRRHWARHAAAGLHRGGNAQPRGRDPGRWPRSRAGPCTSCPPATPSAPTARRPTRRPPWPPGSSPAGRSGPASAHPGGQPLGPRDIAIGVAHRDQADQIRQALTLTASPAAREIRVDTANRLQGAEFAVTIIVHPLSGRRDATNFHLEAGRLCVLASRHRHACIVVARAGIADLLDTHPSNDPIHLGVTARFPDGWEANHAVLAHLENHRVSA